MWERPPCRDAVWTEGAAAIHRDMEAPPTLDADQDRSGQRNPSAHAACATLPPLAARPVTPALFQHQALFFAITKQSSFGIKYE